MISKTVLEMITNDQEAKLVGLQAYNAAIKLAHEVSDVRSVDMLTKILTMEKGHVNWTEVQ